MCFPNPKSELENTVYSFGGVWLWAKCTSSTRVSQGSVYHRSTRHTVPTHTDTLQHVLSSLTQKYTVPFLSLPPILYHTHTQKSTPSVRIRTVHAMSRDRASCTVNVSAVQMINVTRFTFPNVAQIPLSSRFTFCVELTPGPQVKIAAPPCSSLPAHSPLRLHWDIRPAQNWFYSEAMCHEIQRTRTFWNFWPVHKLVH